MIDPATRLSPFIAFSERKYASAQLALTAMPMLRLIQDLAPSESAFASIAKTPAPGVIEKIIIVAKKRLRIQ